MPFRVLYIHFTGAFSGASRSLYEFLAESTPQHISPMFITQRGTVVDYFAKLGPVVSAKGLSQFNNTQYGYYRGVRWLVILRELFYLPYTIHALISAKKKFGVVDIIHVNEFTGLITLWLVKKFFKAPAIVHVRSVARVSSDSLRTRFVDFMFRTLADHVIAIDQNVKASLPESLPVSVIHNSLRLKSQVDTDNISQSLSYISSSSFKVGFVGNLLKVKGIIELIQAAHILKIEGFDVDFVVVGDDAKPSKGIKSTALGFLGLQQNSKAEVERLLEEYDLRDRFHLLGFTANIGQIYRFVNVLCFPSHYDAPGRPIFEAAFYSKPSIVAVQRPFADTLIHGVTGLAISPKSVDEIVSSVKYFINNPDKCILMGAAAKALAEKNFDVVRNSNELIALYKSLQNQS
jgi:glycosyltransferase involved in cell wall biosynthesis